MTELSPSLAREDSSNGDFLCTAEALIGPFLEAVSDMSADPRMAIFEPVRDPVLRGIAEKALRGVNEDIAPKSPRSLRLWGKGLGLFRFGGRKPEDRA